VTSKAQPGVPGARDYIGNSDGPAKGKRAGTEEWVKQAIKYSNGACWNNGTYGQRDVKGKPGTMSVHATGRAMDLSYRKTDTKGVAQGRQAAKAFLDVVVANANKLGVQMIIDYWPTPFGRAWRCDRQAWKAYETKTVSGAPGGDWLHVELSPAMADNPEAVKTIFEAVFGVSATA
jgi:hypothetical protein